MRYLSLICLGLVVFFASACGASRDSLSFDLASQPTYYQDAKVQHGNPQVIVSPTTQPNRQLTALMVPFRLTQQSTEAKQIGRDVSRLFWQVFLSEQIFPIIEYDENAQPYRADYSQRQGVRKKAELVIGGHITQYYSGGAQGVSSLSVTVEIWDLATGNLIWSVSQAASLDPTGYNDYIVMGTRKRVPADPMWMISTTAARDIARVVGAWSNPDHYIDDGQNGEEREPSAF